MPGPDDAASFLHHYAEAQGYTIPDDIDTAAYQQLKAEAEVMRNAKRGLNALLQLYCGAPSTPTGRSARETTVADTNSFAELTGRELG